MSTAPQKPCQCSRFGGKVAVITGSTAGIGFAIAERLGQEGAKVVVSSRDQGRVDEAMQSLRAQGTECTGVTCHVGSKEDRNRLIDTAVQAYGRIDVLVSNAVVNPTFGPMLDTPEAAMDKILSVNVKAGVLLAQSAVAHMPASSGSILFVSSVTAYQPEPPLAMYAISKTALLGVVKALAKELGPRGIRVNGLAPGIVATKLSQALVSSDAAREDQEARTVLGRLGEAREIAAAAAFLLSDDASYVTAETLVAAGGMPSKL